MKRYLFYSLLTSFLALSVGHISAETSIKKIVLQNGQEIVGPILKETDETVIIDLGYDLLRLPRPQIATMADPAHAEDTREGASDEAGPALDSSLPFEKIKSSLRPLDSQELIERVKESVVIVSSSGGWGSGFFIDYEGHIITNFHVVKGDKYQNVTVLRKEGGRTVRKKFEEVEVKAFSELFDIALLKLKDEDVEDLNIRPLPIYTSENLREGDTVYAVGNPGVGRTMLEHSVSKGIISYPNRNFNDILYIQTTAQVNPGNSGGPLINTRGEVVGLVTFKAFFQEGIAFALPAKFMHHFLKNEKAYAFGKNNPNSGYRYMKPYENDAEEMDPEAQEQ